MGKLPIDWEQAGPLIEQRILEEVGRRLIPDLDDRMVTKFHYSPRDFALDMNAFQGSAYSLEPLAQPSGLLRPHNRDGKLTQLLSRRRGHPSGRRRAGRGRTAPG